MRLFGVLPDSSGLFRCQAVRWIIIAFALTGISHTALAQSDSAVSIPQVQQRLQAVKSREELDQATRGRVATLYKKAISALKTAQEDTKHAKSLREEAADAPHETNVAQARLRALAQPISEKSLGSLTVDQLSRRADEVRSDLSSQQSELSDLRDQLTQLAQRPQAARAALADARNTLQSLKTQVVGNNQASVVARARQALNSARRQRLNAKITLLNSELNGLDLRQRLLEARRSLAEARVARDNDSLAAIQAVLGRKQQHSAQSLKRASERKLSELRGAAAPISRAAQRNLELTSQLAATSSRIEALAGRQVSERSRVDALRRRLNLVQRQLEIGGRSVALGNILRAQKRELSESALSVLGKNGQEKIPDVANAELERFQLQQSRSKLAKPANRAQTIAAQAGVDLNAGQRQSLTALMRQRRNIVDRLIDAESQYISIGRDLSSLSAEYRNALASFNRLLDERLFWLPSFSPVSFTWFGHLADNLPWVFSPSSWLATATAFFSGLTRRPWITAAAVILLASLLYGRAPMIRRLKSLAEPVGNVRRDSFWLTLRATLVTIFLSLPVAIALLAIGYLTRQAPDNGGFVRAAAAGVFQLGVLFLFIEPFVHVCRTDGLADKHFLWPADARHGLHQNLRWLLFALIPPTWLITLTQVFDDDAKRQTIGLAAFIFSSLAFAVFAWRLLHPTRGVLSNVLGADHKSYWRLGYVWLPLAVGTPLALSALAAWGYYDTALALQTRVFYSVALLSGGIIIYSLILRWLTVVERRLALTRAHQRREEAREVRATREAAAAAGEGMPDNLDTLEIDLVQISEQTRGLLQIFMTLALGAMLWLVWFDIVPALQVLDNVTLWHYTTHVDNKTQLMNVTLGALMLSLAVGVVTALAGRNLPGFLEITILRRFSMDSGSRYAMATLFQYTIILAGLLVAVGIVGLRWSSIRWLVAALGVGLGFGLQEIFANFVSGIVILFERPIRVGDTVSVDTLTGTVGRVRLRATTITDWDNKEVIIPNRTLITGTVVNWTLTDDITRLIIRIRLALDADTDKAETLIHQAIKAEPAALDEPAPSVFMVGYDDSAIIYEARIFYRDLYNLLPLQHALYKRIHEAFAEHGVEITFPQHNLHLRSVDSSFARLFSRRGDDGSDDPRLADR